MAYSVLLFLMPPVLVFGVYHLAVWFDVAGIGRRVFWRRVAIASVFAHLLLVIGFFLLTYIDYRTNQNLTPTAGSYEMFLFNGSEFWRVMVMFDALPTVVLLGLFGTLDRMGLAAVPLIPLTIGTVLAVGSLQWYWVGGAIGAGFEKLWSGLKTGDDDELPPWL